MAKEQICKWCGSTYHYSIKCFKAPRKPINVSQKPIKRGPIRRPTLKTPTRPSSSPKPLKQPLSRRKQAIKKLDAVFSKYIRARDQLTGKKFKCCSCFQVKPIELADAGHYLSRRHIGTRWDERQVNAECQDCNRRDKDHLKGYKVFLEAKHGPSIISQLKKQTTEPVRTYEIEAMIEEYKQKLLTFKE